MFSLSVNRGRQKGRVMGFMALCVKGKVEDGTSHRLFSWKFGVFREGIEGEEMGALSGVFCVRGRFRVGERGEITGEFHMVGFCGFSVCLGEETRVFDRNNRSFKKFPK